MFKKSLSVILALLMIISCMSTMMFTASAEEFDSTWTGIDSLSDITDLTGKYYLTQNIGSAEAPSATIIGTINDTPFTGIIDGNGHTIYTSVPIFFWFDGTAQNLNISGKITAGLSNLVGALCVAVKDANCKVVLNNVKSDVEISVSGVSYVGGFVGQSLGAVEFIKCENNGVINAVGGMYVGGFVGRVGNNTQSTHTSVFSECINNADMTVTSTGNLYVGGFCGWYFLKNAYNIESCTNNGAIKASSSVPTSARVGGFIGFAQQNNSHSYIDSKNIGVIDVVGVVGGLVGWDNGTVVAINCVNYGSVFSNQTAGGIAGYLAKDSKLIVCVNKGNVTVNDGLNGAVGYFAGGIAGLCSGVNTLHQCANYAEVNCNHTAAPDKTYAAGIIGSGKDGTVFNYCQNTGTISGQEAGVKAEIASTGILNRCGSSDTTVSLDFEGVQRSIAVENETTFSLRFITKITDINKYKSTGVMVYMTEPGTQDVKHTNNNTTTVYTQISGMEDGVNKAYPETVVVGTYYSALTVTDISVTGTYSFIVVPYTVDLDGNYAYADGYTVTVTNGGTPTVTALAPAASN